MTRAFAGDRHRCKPSSSSGSFKRPPPKRLIVASPKWYETDVLNRGTIFLELLTRLPFPLSRLTAFPFDTDLLVGFWTFCSKCNLLSGLALTPPRPTVLSSFWRAFVAC